MFYPGILGGDDPTTNEWVETSTTNDNEKHQDEDDVKKKGSFQALMLRLGWVIESCFFLFLEGLVSIKTNMVVEDLIYRLMIGCLQFHSSFT